MDYSPFAPHGFNLLWGFGILFYAVFVIIAVAVVVALIVLLARFLVVGTKAAQLYLKLNGPATPEPVSYANPVHTPPAPESAPAPAESTPTGVEPVAEEDAVDAPAPAGFEPKSAAAHVNAAHPSDPTPPDIRADDLVFSDDVIPSAVETESEVLEPTVVPPVKKPARAPRKPRTPPISPNE